MCYPTAAGCRVSALFLRTSRTLGPQIAARPSPDRSKGAVESCRLSVELARDFRSDLPHLGGLPAGVLTTIKVAIGLVGPVVVIAVTSTPGFRPAAPTS